MEQAQGSAQVSTSAAGSDGGTVGQQAGGWGAGGVPGGPQQVHHPCELQGVAIGL